MWEGGMGRAEESNAGIMGATVIEQQLKKRKKLAKNYCMYQKVKVHSFEYV